MFLITISLFSFRTLSTGYSVQSRRVPVTGTRLLIKTLDHEAHVAFVKPIGGFVKVVFSKG